MNKLMQPGVWGVLATPFSGSTLEVDDNGVAALAEHAQAVGATGLTVLGVFGEAAKLSWEERRRVLETVLDTTELPLVVGCTSLATAPVIDEARMAVELVGERLAGVMVQANSADRATLATHLRAVNEATGADVVVQDYPIISGVHVSAGVLGDVVAQSPFVTAVKAEAPPTPVAVAELTRRVDVPVFGGLGGINLLDELACGSAGAMTGFSYPEALVATVRAWRDGDRMKARAALLDHLPLITFEQQVGIALAVRKECLRRRGLIAESGVRPPGRSLPDCLAPVLATHIDTVEGR
ncbi:dihydrodipicolinate synthase family protein [Mycolicibacterium smegmatis]|uniref:dihydrodipicolinate synthase family protein n=1 Tax=Mycolicibacterium smegmatis TaxID=1772 RepID=UPI0005D93B12|nr:dihydrodipicolinate synthase family protein [Mycolicibacterium smegmatis]MCP2621610.1 dihydrodipicolinate synthase family protein [Mycolicibacterium smegmatis]MDF1899047.1 dihydrodipicolinate synthase family protein [Mycolicibacterium smegmatis]MDF1904871.1 dihydrodipicolinate synthase family protein [Mycolicibacterium smegmatis]MDF1918740.1 dihydrodipicolinate synthase family protein [Mycolicibacterium smegmatis]MDF1924035.1 dihydrodipicolinate synthase family protein [Mycolicibacterium sm